METYSGMKAESIGAAEMLRFAWRERWHLLSYLAWTGQMRHYAHASERQQENG
jgi:hypothetical protein